MLRSALDPSVTPYSNYPEFISEFVQTPHMKRFQYPYYIWTNHLLSLAALARRTQMYPKQMLCWAYYALKTITIIICEINKLEKQWIIFFGNY